MSLFILLSIYTTKPTFLIMNISNNTIDIEKFRKKKTERQSHFPLTRLIALWQERPDH